MADYLALIMAIIVCAIMVVFVYFVPLIVGKIIIFIKSIFTFYSNFFASSNNLAYFCLISAYFCIIFLIGF